MPNYLLGASSRKRTAVATSNAEAAPKDASEPAAAARAPKPAEPVKSPKSPHTRSSASAPARSSSARLRNHPSFFAKFAVVSDPRVPRCGYLAWIGSSYISNE